MNAYNHFSKPQMLIGYAASKGVPSPKSAVLFAGLLLLIGGLGIVLGSFVTLALLALVVFLVPVTFMMHAYWKDADPNSKMSNRVNFYKNMALLGAVLMFLAIPQPWVFSL